MAASTTTEFMNELASGAPPRERETPELSATLDRTRRIGFAFPLLILSVFLVFGAEPWRYGLVLCALVPLTLYTLLVPRPGPHGVTAMTYVGQTCGIVATGGLHSPFVVLLVAGALVSGLSLAHSRRHVLPLVYSLAFLGALAWLAWSGRAPGLVPGFFDPATPVGAILTPLTFALLLGVVTTFVNRVARQSRREVVEGYQATELSRREAIESGREHNRQLRELTSSVAHELKTPLTAIQGLATLLETKAEPESAEAKRLGVLVAEVHRMGATLEEFLNFSRPLTPLALEPTALGRLAGEMAVMYEGLARRRGVRLSLDLDPRLEARCDPRKVKQALVNLLQNAFDAAPEGSELRLRVARDESGDAELAVIDQGAGVPAEVRRHLFRPGATSKPDGSGFGLVMVRSIAEQHGGRFELRDAPGGGTCATLTLPLSAAGAAS